jgi:hypothetical protein
MGACGQFDPPGQRKRRETSRAARETTEPAAIYHVSGDELTEALLPAAARLITAVHARNASEVQAAITDAAWTAGSSYAGVRHLAVLLAAMVDEDTHVLTALAWTDAEVA